MFVKPGVGVHMFLYQITKLRESLFQQFFHKLFTHILSLKPKSDHGKSERGYESGGKLPHSLPSSPI